MYRLNVKLAKQNKLIYNYVVSVYWWTYVHKRIRCTKRIVIRPGVETVSWQHAAHAQQRSYSIHAESFSSNQVSERKTLLLGWQTYFRFRCLRANGKRSELLPNQSTDGMGFLGYFLVLRKPLLVHFCFVLWVLLSSVSFQSFVLRHLVIAAIYKAKKFTSSVKLLTFN